MLEFELNKLVRDKLPSDYERLGQQAKYKELTPDEHKNELFNKIIEEVHEAKTVDSVDEIKSEIADIYQALDDLIKLYNISPNEIRTIQQEKFDKKGGFTNGIYVKTLKLSNNDKWVDYYKSNPNIFPEM